MRLWIGLHLPRLSLEVFTPSWSTDTGSVVLEQERVLAASSAALDAGVRTGMRASSSRPNGPGRSSTDPPWSVIDCAISARISSQMPSLRGAANACTWSTDSSSATDTPVTTPDFWSISIRSSIPWTPGTRTAPRSTRARSGTSSSASQGPPVRSVAGSPSLRDVVFLGGASAVGAIVAVLVVIAPSGVGVREGAMYKLIEVIAPSGAALGTVVLNRLAITLVEAALLRKESRGGHYRASL